MRLMRHSILQEVCAHYRLDYLTAESPPPHLLERSGATVAYGSGGYPEYFWPIYCRWAFRGQHFAVALTPILRTVIYKPKRWLVFPMTQPGSHHHEYDDAAMLKDICTHTEISVPSSAFLDNLFVKPLDKLISV